MHEDRKKGFTPKCLGRTGSEKNVKGYSANPKPRGQTKESELKFTPLHTVTFKVQF